MGEKGSKSTGKFIASLLYTAIMICITSFAVIIGLNFINATLNLNWDWVLFSDQEWIKNITNFLSEQSKNDPSKRLGMLLIVSGATVLLAYSTIIILLKKIPFIGSLVKALTGVIGVTSILGLILGFVFFFMESEQLDNFLSSFNI